MPRETKERDLPVYLRRLVDVAEPRADDDCLDISYGTAPLAEAMTPRVRQVTAVDTVAALPFPDASFTLVTSRFSLHHHADPTVPLREMVRVCRPDGRVVMTELVCTSRTAGERDRIERLRDPSCCTVPPLRRLEEMVTAAGAEIRRLDVFQVERPVAPWLAEVGDPVATVQVREALESELAGGQSTGTRPRLISGELWFTQSWAHLAAVPR